MSKNKTLKIAIILILVSSSYVYAGGKKNKSSSNIGAGLISSFLSGLTGNGNLDVSGLIGQFLNFGVPGAGRVKLSCDEPDFEFEKLDLCSLVDGIGLEIPTFPSFGFTIGNCDIGMDFANNSSRESCQRKRFSSLCDKDDPTEFSLNDYKNGIGTNNKDATQMLAIMGGKGIFGKDSCAQDSRRYSGWQMGDPGYSHPDIKGNGKSRKGKSRKGKSSPSLTKHLKISVNGSLVASASASASASATSGNASNGSKKETWESRALFDEEIGGSPKFLNTRRASAMFRCIEAAKENNLEPDECYFNAENPGSDKKDYEIEAKLSEKAKYDMGPVSENIDGKYGDKVDRYWKLFSNKADKENISDWKMLLAIGIHESGLDPTAQGAPNSDGSRDYGMMQINSRWHKKNINERYGSYGGFWQALMIPEVAVDYGAEVFGDCEKKYGASWQAVDCYNKGPTNAKTASSYIEKVKQEYQKLGGKDFGDADSPYGEDVKISQRIAAFAALSLIAVENKKTLTHLGMDTVELLPIEKQKAYIELVDRHIAQKTFILASYKKAGDLEKAIYHIRDYGSGVSRGPALPDN